MAKKNIPYFEDFITMIGFSCQAAEYLQTTLENFNPAVLEENRKVMHQIENNEDELKHSIMSRLIKEFITPIDREDIIQIANELDDITDKIEDILIRLHMYNIKTIREDALSYTKIIVRACATLQKAMIEFPNFRKSPHLTDAIIEINSIEEEGDMLYIQAVRKLFENETDPIAITAWSKIFDLMEDCCDTCEHAANVMESVTMKNT